MIKLLSVVILVFSLSDCSLKSNHSGIVRNQTPPDDIILPENTTPSEEDLLTKIKIKTFGKVTTTIGTQSEARAVSIDSSGRIVVAGYSKGSDYDFALARYNSDGSLDATFGTNGIVTTNTGSSDFISAILIDSSGKIIVSGTAGSDFALARYTSGGSLDATFGTNGIVTTDLGSGDDGISAMSFDLSGNIVVAGSSNNDFALARYTSGGSLDTTFGTNGKVITAIGISIDYINSMLIDSSDRILVVGNSYNAGSDYDFALARYNSDGSLDATFGTSGIVTTAIGSGEDQDQAYAVSIDSNDKILVSGFSLSGNDYNFALARYTNSGILDTTFGTNGKVITAIGSGDNRSYAMSIDSSGKIILAGFASLNFDYNFVLARYSSNGILDTDFGVNGIVATDIGSAIAYAMSIDSTGKIVAAGRFHDGSKFGFALARYNPDGSLDSFINSNSYLKAININTDIVLTFTQTIVCPLELDGLIVLKDGSANSVACLLYTSEAETVGSDLQHTSIH